MLVMLPMLLGCQQWIVGPGLDTPPAPHELVSTSLDGAIALSWTDNAHDWDPGLFLLYRVWSSRYDLDAERCVGGWDVEGTTVAPEFVVGALGNGVPHCFRVEAETIEGVTSAFSPIRFDTPRFDAAGVALFAGEVDNTRAGFRFWVDQNGDARATRAELAIIAPGDVSVDFALHRDPDGSFWLEPRRAGTRIAVWGNAPVASLTEIDLAPATGYTRDLVEALPGWGYVVEMDGPDGWKRFGALRITAAGAGYLLLEWAFQDDPGNPELLRDA
jgi:hypothetical protein